MIQYSVLSQIWGCAPRTAALDLLDRVQKHIVNLIHPVLSAGFQSFSHRRDVEGLTLFYVSMQNVLKNLLILFLTVGQC